MGNDVFLTNGIKWSQKETNPIDTTWRTAYN